MYFLADQGRIQVKEYEIQKSVPVAGAAGYAGGGSRLVCDAVSLLRSFLGGTGRGAAGSVDLLSGLGEAACRGAGL